MGGVKRGGDRWSIKGNIHVHCTVINSINLQYTNNYN